MPKRLTRHEPKGGQSGRGFQCWPRADAASPAHRSGLTPSGAVSVWNVVSPIAPTRTVDSGPQGSTRRRAGKGRRSKRRPVCNGPDRGSNFAPPRKGADFRRVLDHETETNRLDRRGYCGQCAPLAALKARRVRRELKPYGASLPLRQPLATPGREGGSHQPAGCFAVPYQRLSPVRGNSPAGFLGGRVVVTPPCYPTCPLCRPHVLRHLARRQGSVHSP
jgi:hypothetical protein